jgi:GWxTD domain-containing protein
MAEANKIISKLKYEEGSSIEDLFYNGKIALLKFDLVKARDLLDKALDKDNSNIEIHYYLGIACRELAKRKAYLTLPDKMYEKSKENLLLVINHDSTYKDVLFQYGLLMDYLGKNVETIENMIEQIRLKPDMIETYIGLRNIFVRDINEKKSKNKDADILFENYMNLKDNDFRDYLYGELLRIMKKESEAENIFIHLLQESAKIPKALIFNSLIKLYAQLDEKQKLENCFWKAVSELKSNIDADILFHYLKYISNSEEIQEYQELSYQDKKKFFKAFWEAHNPMPTMKNNPRIFEHYKRIVEAEEKYEYIRERFYFSRIKLEEFTDQGIIYIRLGEPDTIIITSVSDELRPLNPHESAHDPSTSFYDDDVISIASNYFSNVIETWFYSQGKETPDMEFHFWRNTKKFLTYIVDHDALVDREFLNPIYRRILTTTILDGKNYFIEQKTKENSNTIKLGLTKEFSTWDKTAKTFGLTNSVYTFRGPNRKTAIDLTYLINKSLIFKDIPDSIKELKSELNIGIYDKNWNQMVLRSDTIILNRPKRETDAEFRFNRFNINPDSCEIALVFNPIGTEIYGKSKISLNIPDYSTGGLKISDIEIGIEKASGNKIFNKNGHIILPKVIPSHDLKTPLAAYYEIYNLKKNLDGKVVYKIEYSIKYMGSENILKKLLSSGNRESSISMEYSQTGKEETSKEFLNFDLNKLVPGEYVLEVKITDINASKSVTQKRDIELYEGE